MIKEIWCPLEELKKERLWYSVVVRDRQGKVLSRERRKAHSFLRAWNDMVYVHKMHRSLSLGFVDTAGVARSGSDNAYNFWMATTISQTTYGIRVGTGNTPVAIEDYALETPIAQGVVAGQMEHLACTVAVPVVAAPSCSFLVSRIIENNSGGDITVREAGIYMRLGSSYYVCGARDVLGVPQLVPNGGDITIEWTIGVTV